MTKYEWTKRQVEIATEDYSPDTRKYIDAFLKAVKEAGQDLTRTRFFELYEEGRPGDDEEADYFDYAVLDDHWVLVADFSEAWEIVAPEPLPLITTKAMAGGTALPDDFCTLGGTPELIQDALLPICPRCDKEMVLFLQLKSLPHKITRKNEALRAFSFGDAGNFHLFHCPDCLTYKTSEQSH